MKDISMKTATEKELGQYIVSSPLFRRSLKQEHHFDTTLGRHSIEVTKAAMRLCSKLDQLGIQTDHNCMMVASLCHDLGMVDRNDRYQNNMECCQKHPGNSVTEALKLLPDLDQKTQDAILSHMWPLSRHMPSSKEGWILLAADKYVSSAGTIRHLLEKIK